MQTLTIEKKNAIAAYKVAGEETKEVLRALFGREIFSNKITERVATFADALDILGDEVTDDQKILLAYNGLDSDMISAKAYMQLVIITKVLNEGWQPDWQNPHEFKFFPWFKYYPDFHLSIFMNESISSNVNYNSRLCFKSFELAKYAANQFINIYADYLNIKEIKIRQS